MDAHIPADPFAIPRHDGVVTLWFVTSARPEAVIAQNPKADRGFGRKLLAQMNPRWPITPIGQFYLNRSAKASSGEFYIAGYPGLAVVQTCLEDITKLSEIPRNLRTCVPAADVYVFAENRDEGIGGFAHFSGDHLRRSFCAKRSQVFEDHGLPEPFESPFWKGERAEPAGPIDLPFAPLDLMAQAQQSWLGFGDDADVHVAAFAVDGRPEPKVDTRRAVTNATEQAQETSAAASAKLGFRDYDDYERDQEIEEPIGEELKDLARRGKRVMKDVGSTVMRKFRRTK